MKAKTLFFFLGTEAELMKMFAVIKLARERGFNCQIISNGQNIIKDSLFLPMTGGKIDIDISGNASKAKNMFGYLKWFLKTEKEGRQILKEKLKKYGKDNCLLVVHGDTLSTLMGSRIAYKIGMDYVHVESGPGSHHWFSPFPEEIDRYCSSLHSKINFCPKDDYMKYAEKKFKGKAVSTVYNTGIETLNYALQVNSEKNAANPMTEPYFILAIHRQENLLSKAFMQKTVKHIEDVCTKIKCVFIYHIQTYDALKKFGLWDRLLENNNIKIIERLPYTDFINYVYHSEFIIADGCGNQQEFYYLGKPYLIMRTEVEKSSEGIGENARYFGGDFSEINQFYNNYKKYIRPAIKPKALPSEIIINSIEKYFDR